MSERREKSRLEAELDALEQTLHEGLSSAEGQVFGLLNRYRHLAQTHARLQSRYMDLWDRLDDCVKAIDSRDEFRMQTAALAAGMAIQRNPWDAEDL